MSNVSNSQFIPVLHFLSEHTLQENLLNLNKQILSTLEIKIKLNIAEYGVHILENLGGWVSG
jgi:hypothetical protein